MAFIKSVPVHFLILVIFLANACQAQLSRVVIEKDSARQLGMVVEWQTQVQVAPRAKLQNLTQVFGKTKRLVKYVATNNDPKGAITEEFFEDDVDRFGRPIGVNGAKARADLRLERYKSIGFDKATVTRVVEDPDVISKEYAALKKKYESAQGFERGRLARQLSQMEARRVRLLPEITFLAQTTSAHVQSIDGRTGKTNWNQQIGKRNHPTVPIVAKRDHFAVVNATHIYCCSMANGRVIWQRDCRGAPGSRSAMTLNSIFVPMVDGFVEQFQIRDGDAPSGDILSIGHSLLGATSSDFVVAWPSDRGELNVAYAERETKKVSYRLVPKRKIVSNAAFQSPYLFATSTDGSIYCLNESNGNIIWDLPTGVSIPNSPVPIDNKVYFVNDVFQLNQVAIDGGIPEWTVENILKVVCASKKRVYCLNRQRHLVVLNKSDGSFIGNLTQLPVEYVYQNMMSDRLVVGTERGLVQCLREAENVEPIYYQKPEVAEASTEKTEKPAANGTQPNNNQGGNPFGGGGNKNDPFGGGANQNNNDPFGGGGKANDPFGGGGAAKSNDDDPFGN